jgi:predicted SprT family Zn-dependent metalloprotease
MHTANDPTKQSYATLQAAWRHFNKALFDGRLPTCLITFQRRARSYGYFAHERFEHRADGSTTSELAMNPRHFNERSPEATLSTLVHEMVHGQQRHFGNPGRGGYHNKEWADLMSAIGLEPSSTGKPGGKRTGQQVSHWIVPGGPFDVACKAFLEKNQGLLWGDRPVDPKGGGGKRSKYTCPEDGIAMWGRPGVQVLCGEHDTPVPMIEIAPAIADALAA